MPENFHGVIWNVNYIAKKVCGSSEVYHETFYEIDSKDRKGYCTTTQSETSEAHSENVNWRYLTQTENVTFCMTTNSFASSNRQQVISIVSRNKVARYQPPAPLNKYKLNCIKFNHKLVMCQELYSFRAQQWCWWDSYHSIIECATLYRLTLGYQRSG